jgi:hypothetical protein
LFVELQEWIAEGKEIREVANMTTAAMWARAV